jgi:hypothetical protein
MACRGTALLLEPYDDDDDVTWGRSFNIATGCRLDNRGSILGRSKVFSSSPRPGSRFWSTPRILSNTYRRLLLRGYSNRSVKLSILLIYEYNCIIVEANTIRSYTPIPSPVNFYGVLCNYIFFFWPSL